LQNVRVDTQYVGIIEEQKQQIKELKEELAEFSHVQYSIARKCKQGEESFEDIKEDEYDCNRPHKSASSCFLCKRSHLARKQDASKELE
jgi:cell division septum initiation protein DivIVA